VTVPRHLREVLSRAPASAEPGRGTPVRPALGTFLKIGHPDVPALLALAGFDFVVIDMEHAPLGPAEVHLLIGAALGAGLPPLVRVPDHSASTIGRVLDSGAHGVLVPHVSTAGQAAAMVAAARLPPHGKRGYGPTVRAGAYGSDTAGYREGAGEALVIPQIEDPEGVAASADILATPGIDHAFVGAADLAASTGLHPDAPEFTALLETVRDAAESAGTGLGTAVGAQGPPRPPPGLEPASFLAVSNDASLLLTAGRSITTHG